MTLDDEARAELRELEQQHLLRVPRVLEGRQGPIVSIDGTELVSFASNDYLGLAGDPRLVRAAADALDEYGVGAGASRLLAGNHREHVALEAAVREWMQCDGVRLFNTGYAANVGVLTALLRAGDVVFSDELVHASMIDGCRLSRAEVVVYPHGDLAALERMLQARSGDAIRRRLVVSESVFSMDGDLVDVERLVAIAHRHGAAVVLDEAHAIGVVGEQGRGAASTSAARPDLVIGTFGKALGTFGAFAATTRAIADLLWNRARPLVFSTGLPPSIARASRAAIEIVRGAEGAQRRAHVLEHARTFRGLVEGARGDAASPIAPVLVGDDARVMQIGSALAGAGYFVASVRPPTVPRGTARLRVSFSAAHTERQVRGLATATQCVIVGEP
ncbi:MAG TPA: 8-amino-7-oxononanoate synthase [Kofleriaceae bacterium]|nr:8-amino-7-oxononanoate synthase [Kofleriaceae bacterium]